MRFSTQGDGDVVDLTEGILDVVSSSGVTEFAEDVRERRYPAEEHCYTMAPDEEARLREVLERSASAQQFSGEWSL